METSDKIRISISEKQERFDKNPKNDISPSKLSTIAAPPYYVQAPRLSQAPPSHLGFTPPSEGQPASEGQQAASTEGGEPVPPNDGPQPRLSLVPESQSHIPESSGDQPVPGQQAALPEGGEPVPPYYVPQPYEHLFIPPAYRLKFKTEHTSTRINRAPFPKREHVPYMFTWPRPMIVPCPYCELPILTKTSCKPTRKAWLGFLVLLIFCCPLCWIPFLLFQRIEHRCGDCHVIIGVFKGNTFANGGGGGHQCCC